MSAVANSVRNSSFAGRYWYIWTGLTAGSVFGYLSGSLSPMLAIAAIVGAIFCYVVLRKPEYGLYALAALVPIERFGRFTDDNTEFTVSLMRLAGVVILAIFLVHKTVRKKPIKFGKPFWLYTGYAVFAFLSVVYTTDFLGTVRAASTILGNLLFFLLISNLATTKNLILKAVTVWLVVSVSIGIYSVYDWHLGTGKSGDIITGTKDPGKGVQTTKNRFSTVWEDRAELASLGGKSLRRTMGSTSHSAVYGINLIMTIPFLFFMLKLPIRRGARFLIWASLAVVFYNILLTNTRGTILIAAFTCLLVLVYKFHRINLSQIIIGLVASAIMLSFVPEDVYNRVLDISNYTEKKSASIRIREEYFTAGLKAFSDHWLLGMGVANENIIPAYLDTTSTAPRQTTVHNEYLQSLIELGIIGASLLFAFVAVLLRYSIKAAKIFRQYPDTVQEYWFMVATQILMISVLVYGVQVDVFHFPLKGWWLIAGLTVPLYQMAQKRQLQENNTNNHKAQEA